VKVQRAKWSPDAISALSRVPEVKKQVRAVAAAVRDDARQLAPVDEGDLRRGITVVNNYDRERKLVTYRVGWRTDIAFYGGLIELGTEDTAPQPHLRPAAWKHGARFRFR
jgi:HK97 gp10 family phage protein